MQNRFTIKDFVFLVLGLLVCLLLFLTLVKTDREVAAIARVDETLRQQQATLGKLEEALSRLGQSRVVQAAPAPTALQATSDSAPTSMDVPHNVAEDPSYEPGYDIQFAAASDCVNREGRPQQWQTAADDELPDDFAEGGELIYVWNSGPQSLTPYVSRDSYSTRLYREILEPLCWQNVDPPFQYVPALARSWEVSEDGMTLTFHLFENANWSDGFPVTADDVIFTFDLVFNEEIDAPVSRSYMKENIASYEKLDAHTVRFHMLAPYFDAVGVCGNYWILPRHVYGQYSPEEFNTRLNDLCVGSGPWRLESWEQGVQLTLVRNENYWGPKPALAKQTIRIIQSELSEMQEFKAGNVDFIQPTADQWIQHADADWPAIRGGREVVDVYYFSPNMGYTYIGYNLRLEKLADKRVRQAFTMLLDREELIDTLRSGLGNVITGPFFYQADQYDQTIEPWPYDPPRAKRLLADAGWEDTDGDGIIDRDLDGDGTREPFEVTFLMPSGSSFTERLQRYVHEQFRQAGILVNLDTLEWSVFNARLIERDFEMVSLSFTGNPEADPFQAWHSSQAENRGSNYAGFKNAEADRIIEEARRTLDYDRRMELWHAFHAIIHEEQPYTFLSNRPTLGFLDARFRNVREHPMRHYVAEWFVPADAQLH